MRRTALVTGGTGGIGGAVVRRLRADGYDVVFTGRDEGRGSALERESGAVFCRADAADRAACDASIAFALERLGGIGLLVANAGILVQGTLAATTDAEFDRLVEINLTSVFRCGRALFGPMRAQGGGVMALIASDSAIRGSHRIPAYSVVKAGVVAVAELLGAEGAPHGIRANALCPGNTLPGMLGDDASGWRATARGSFATGDDIAAAVAFLASTAGRAPRCRPPRAADGRRGALQRLTRA
jgi:NAD(P)-dependent dehydrogenase (short-subunit alcohol dehydrogenase family)